MAEKRAKIVRDNKFYDEYPCCRIRERITDLGWTLMDAAEKMKEAGIQNVTAEAVRQWTGGYSRPDISKLTNIAQVLNCSINYLFGVDDLPDMTNDQIYQLTGLDTKSIEALKGYMAHNLHQDLKTINAIIGDEEKHNLLGRISAYLQDIDNVNIQFVITNKTTGNNSTLFRYDGLSLLQTQMFEDIKLSLNTMKKNSCNSGLHSNLATKDEIIENSAEG